MDELEINNDAELGGPTGQIQMDPDQIGKDMVKPRVWSFEELKGHINTPAPSPSPNLDPWDAMMERNKKPNPAAAAAVASHYAD
jgi:hypothetical protein